MKYGHKKALFSGIFAFLLLLAVLFAFPRFAYAGALTVTASGSCGQQASWALDSDGTLTISGTGPADGWESFSAPWKDHLREIKTVVIENGITAIGETAFYNCISLTEVSLPNSLTSIGENAFRYCSKLKEISIPSSVAEIGDAAFYSCVQLTGIVIPEGVTRIGDDMFYSGRNLVSVSLPDSVTSIGDTAFKSCDKLPAINLPKNLKEIGQGAFSQCKSLTGITLPNGLTSIGDGAFAACSSLTEILVPDTVTSIGSSAFSNCSMLERCTIPKGITRLEDSLFSNDHLLTDVQLPSSVTNIGQMAFYSCNALTELDLPDGLTYIDDSAFADCSSLQHIEIPNGVTSLGLYAFNNCTSLESIELPSYMTAIGEGSFWNCPTLKSVVIPEGVTSLERYLFTNCQSLTHVELPDTLTRIDESAFNSCTSLEEIDIPDGVRHMGVAVFRFCKSLKSLRIPEGMTAINTSLCEDCESLTEITLPNSLREIYALSLSGCPISEIHLSKNVIHVYNQAFYNCQNLTDVYYGGTETDRAGIEIGTNNEPLLEAVWHYTTPVDPIRVKTISLDQTAITLPLLESRRLAASIQPKNADNQEIRWVSSDAAVASVDANGLVTAHKYGTAVITAIAQDDPTEKIKASCTVQTRFSDALDTGKYYYAPIYWAADKGITQGYSSGEHAGSFGVGLPCTRGELMVFLWRSQGSPAGYGDARLLFNDVLYSTTSAFNKAIAWGYKTGIVKGYADGGFHPESTIVRKDVMIMLYRVAGKPSVSGTVSFSDVAANGYAKTSDTYKAILWGVQNKITNGYSSGPYAGQFGCLLNCERQDIVTFLYRAYK